MATDDAGRLIGWSDEARRSDDDMGFSRRSDDMGFSADDEDGGLVSMGEASVLTDNCTGSDGWLDVGRGGVLTSSVFWLAAATSHKKSHNRSWASVHEQVSDYIFKNTT